MLDNEGILLLQKLLQYNQSPISDQSPYRGHQFTEKPVKIMEFIGSKIKEFRLEAQLESYLLNNRGKLMQLSGFSSEASNNFRVSVLNQVSTYVAGGGIDIVCMYEKKVIDLWLLLNTSVIELKKSVLVPDNVDQLIEYIEWAERIIPGSHRKMIKGILVGRDFARQTDKRDRIIEAVEGVSTQYQIECYQYVVSESEDSIEFQKIV